MPKILTLTLFHLVAATASGYLIGLGVFGVGFSDQVAAKSVYTVFVYAWQVLDAPAGVYFIQSQSPDWVLFGALQLLTSFLWANIIAFTATGWKKYRRSKRRMG